MTIYFADRVREVAVANGASSLTLQGAVDQSWKRFSDCIPINGYTIYCVIDGLAWEIGLGQLTRPNTLVRTTVRSSSATTTRVNNQEAGTPVRLTLSSNQLIVFCSPSAEDILLIDAFSGGFSDPTQVRACIYLPTLTDLKAENALTDKETIIVLGGTAVGDGRGGVFQWQATNSGLADNVDTFASNHYSTGLWVRIRTAEREYVDDLFEIDASAPSSDGATLRIYGETKADHPNSWFGSYVDRAAKALRIIARWNQAGATSFLSFFSLGDTGDRIEAHAPLVLASRSDATDFVARSLAFLSSTARLVFGSAALNWEVPLTKGGYLAGVHLTVAALKGVDAASQFGDGQRALVLGEAAFGDCAPFVVQWSATSTATADDALVFQPTAGGTGRWLRASAGVSRTLAASATPSVKNGTFFTTQGTTKITNFLNGYPGQIIVVERGASDIQIANNGNIDVLGADTTLTAAAPRAVFGLVGTTWRLLARPTVTDLVVGTNVQAHSTMLDALGALTGVSGSSIVFGSDNAPTVAPITTTTLGITHLIAKAHCVINGTATPLAVRAQQNVSSVTDNGSGDYTINFAAGLFADINYTALAGPGTTTVTNGDDIRRLATPTATAYRVSCGAGGSLVDIDFLSMGFFQ